MPQGLKGSKCGGWGLSGSGSRLPVPVEFALQSDVSLLQSRKVHLNPHAMLLSALAKKSDQGKKKKKMQTVRSRKLEDLATPRDDRWAGAMWNENKGRGWGENWGMGDYRRNGKPRAIS